MTPTRKVTFYEQQASGAALRLECGHWVCVGGMTERPDEYRCGQSPCYKPEKGMGSNGGIFGGAA